MSEMVENEAATVGNTAGEKIKSSNEAKWYVAHTYSGYENKVKSDIEKTIENRKLQDQILEVAVPVQDVVETKNGAKKTVSRKMFPGYVLINMSLGINAKEVKIDVEVGDTIKVITGAWEGNSGEIKSINEGKQTVTIEVDIFGRATSVEIGFADIQKM